MRSLLLALLLTVTVPLLAAEDEVRKVMDQYVAAWLAGDSAAVMRFLTGDAVLIPGHRAPYVGAPAIRSYWWPPEGPAIRLTRFDNEIDAITSTADQAVVRGRQVIEWTSGNERWRAKGNFVTVLRRAGDEWRIALQMAASAPSEKLE